MTQNELKEIKQLLNEHSKNIDTKIDKKIKELEKTTAPAMVPIPIIPSSDVVPPTISNSPVEIEPGVVQFVIRYGKNEWPFNLKI